MKLFEWFLPYSLFTLEEVEKNRLNLLKYKTSVIISYDIGQFYKIDPFISLSKLISKMTGELNETQMNNILSSQAIGRMACTDGKCPYIIPMTFTFDGNYIYGQAFEGKKLDILRKNSNTCFQVDIVTDIYNWQSVIIYGQFEELIGEKSAEAREILFSRVIPLMTSSSIHHHEHAVGTSQEISDENRVKPIMFRIRINEKTGRYEKT